MSETTTVTVGEREYVLRPFRGLKALSLMTSIGGLMKTLPDLQDQIAEAQRRHRDQNMIDIPRAAFELRYPEDAKNVSQEAWDQSGGSVRLPDPDAQLGWEQILLSVLPTIMDEARDQVLTVMALVVIPDRELQAADEEDKVTEALAAVSKQLLYEGTLDELAELALRSVELVKEQFQGKVGELIEQVGNLFGAEETEAEEIKIGTVETPETSNETSSTPSPAPTDGPEPMSSEPAGTTSAATSTA
jgi:hypothetical protein